jgi:hypothetical protein
MKKLKLTGGLLIEQLENLDTAFKEVGKHGALNFQVVAAIADSDGQFRAHPFSNLTVAELEDGQKVIVLQIGPDLSLIKKGWGV